MSNTTQQKPTQAAPSSNPGNAGNKDKVSPIAGKDMKGESCSTSKDKSSDCGTKSSKA